MIICPTTFHILVADICKCSCWYCIGESFITQAVEICKTKNNEYIKLVKHNLVQIIKTYSMFCNFLFIHWCQFLHKLLRISSMKWNVNKRKSVDNLSAFSKEPLFTYLYIIETMFFFYIHEKWCLLIIQCKESKVYAGSMIRKLKHFISNIMIKWQLAPVIYTKADEYSFVSPSWSGSKLKSPSKMISFSPRNN